VLFDQGHNPRDVGGAEYKSEAKDDDDDDRGGDSSLRCEHGAILFNFKKAEVRASDLKRR
jgi:hypothetical protein